MKLRLLRLLSLMLALCLIVPFALAEEAGDESLNPDVMPAVNPEDDENTEPEIIETLAYSPDKLFVMGGELYAQMWDGVYRAVEGGWERRALDIQNGQAAACAATEEGLYLLIRHYPGYNPETEETILPDDGLFEIARVPMGADGQLGKPETLCGVTWDLREESWPQFYAMSVIGGNAYILLHDDEESNWDLNAIYRVSLTDGKGAKLVGDYLTGMVDYKDGQLVAVRFNWEEAYKEGELVSLPEVVSIQTATGELTALGTLPSTNCGALVYDPETDGLYCADSSYVYRFRSDFSAAEPVGYMASSNMSRENAAATIYNGRYYVGDWRDASYYLSTTIDPALLPTRTLRLGNVWNVDSVVADFAKEHPDVAVEYVNVTGGAAAEDFRSHMESPQAADIYMLNLPYEPYAPLLKYGLLTDLSGSEKLMELTGRMYPHMTRPYLFDGKLYGLPVYLYSGSYAYYPGALEKVGMTAEDMPTTYEALLDFLADWYYDYADEYENMQIFEWSRDLREALIREIFYTQALLCDARGQAFTFRTPTIQKLLQRIDSPEMAAVFEALGPKTDAMGAEVTVYDYDEGPNAIFTSSYDPLPSMYQTWMPSVPLLLRMDEDSEPVIQVYTQLMVVNRASKNQDLAMELLEYISEHLPQNIKTTMIAGEDEPIELEYYQHNLDYTQKQLDKARKQLDEATDPEVINDYKETVEWYEKQLERIEEEEHWATTAEEIAFYREHIADHLVVTANSPFTGKDNPLSNLLSQYLEGARDLNAFLSEIDRVVSMIELEGK